MSWKEILTKVLDQKLQQLGKKPKNVSDLLYLQDNKISLDNHIESFQYLLNRKPNKVLEIGCGNGSVLKLFSDQGSKVFGTDYVEKSIEICKQVMPNDQFKACEASILPFDNKFDLIMSNSVFQYFESWAYTKDVVEKLISHLENNGLLVISDIPSESQKDDLIDLRRSKLGLSRKDWDKRYQDLPQQSYDEENFSQFISSLGLKSEIIKPSNYKSEHQKFKFDILVSNI